MPDNYNFKPPAAATASGGVGGGGSMQRQMATAVDLQQEPLRCPRCDSSNTKFCYYNNYSLSQPRYFCKSCKRYWTRGGTLRNIPIGGSCQKNKRGVKRPAPAAATGAVASVGSRSAGGGNKVSPLFCYGNPTKVDLGYASLGFPSLIGGNVDVVPSANSVILGYGTSSDFSPTMSLDGIPTVASSLLVSTIFQDHYKFMSMGGLGFKEDTGIRNNLKPLYPLENVQLKFDEGRHVDDINWSVPCQTQTQEIDPSDLTKSWGWNTIANGTVVSWHHKPGSNAGSSVPSLI